MEGQNRVRAALRDFEAELCALRTKTADWKIEIETRVARSRELAALSRDMLRRHSDGGQL